MNSTPNYGFDLSICGTDMLNRELADKVSRCEFEKHLLESKHCNSCKKPGSCNDRPDCDCDCYTKEEIDQLLSKIACECECYSKEEVDSLLENKANIDDVPSLIDTYTKTEIDNLLSKKENIGPYPIYRLPALSGYTGAVTYWRDGSGSVFVWVEVSKTSGTIANNTVLGTLPVGFRPNARRANAQGYSSSGRQNILVYFAADGRIMVQGITNEPLSVFCFAGFQAAE